MTEYQVLSDDPRSPRAAGAAEEAVLRRLLHGAVFDPRSARIARSAQPSHVAPATVTDPAPEQRRTTAAHCRYAMDYED